MLIPCLDEEHGIAGVVAEFRRELPEARVLVVDNGSTDDTARRAVQAGRRGLARAATGQGARDHDRVRAPRGGRRDHGGRRRQLPRRRRPHPARGVPQGPGRHGDRPAHARVRDHGVSAVPSRRAARRSHGCSAWCSTTSLAICSRGFASSRSASTRTFRSCSAASSSRPSSPCRRSRKGFRLTEVPVPFRERAEGSSSKLRTVRDGFRIFRLLFVLARDYRPLVFFGGIALPVLRGRPRRGVAADRRVLPGRGSSAASRSRSWPPVS